METSIQLFQKTLLSRDKLVELKNIPMIQENMSNNPFESDINAHVKATNKRDSSDKLYQTCMKFEPTSCPCVGKSILPGTEVRLVSNHVAYPDTRGTPCINHITGEQMTSTPEYKECLLAATCQHFFPEMKEKYSNLCTNPRECNVPEYTGYASGVVAAAKSSRW
jgi:hypothetical protein